MAVVQNNKLLDIRQEWQMMTPAPFTFINQGIFGVFDPSGLTNYSWHFPGQGVNNLVGNYLYNHNEDSWVLCPDPTFTGSSLFGVSCCGAFHPWSKNFVAAGGSTTTVTIAQGTSNISGIALGSTIEFLSSGINSGLRRIVTGYSLIAGVITLTFDSVPTTVLTSHTFRLSTGRFYVISAWSSPISGMFKFLDVVTMSWTSTLSILGLPSTSGGFTIASGLLKECRMNVCYQINAIFATGTATSAGTITLTNSAKNWTVNQFCNYQIRITGGTGVGQTMTIASNTSTTITVSSSWSVQPDNTSTYAIEGNEDFIYYGGNGDSILYRYSISADTWTTLSPTVARAGVTNLGMTADWIGISGNSTWANENNLQDGRYIYSLRGSTSAFDKFDIAGGTAGAGAWSVVNMININQGGGSNTSSSVADGANIYINVKTNVGGNSQNSYVIYDVTTNNLTSLTTNDYTTTYIPYGNKIWIKKYNSQIKWLYIMSDTNVVLQRLMLF